MCGQESKREGETAERVMRVEQKLINCVEAGQGWREEMVGRIRETQWDHLPAKGSDRTRSNILTDAFREPWRCKRYLIERENGLGGLRDIVHIKEDFI